MPVLVRPARSLPRERVQAAGIGACTADVPRDPDAHRPGAGIAGSSIKGFWGRKGADHDGRGAMKANDEVPAPQGKLTLGFHCPKGGGGGGTLLLPRPKDGQNPAITSGIWGMSVQSVQILRPETRERGMSDERN